MTHMWVFSSIPFVIMQSPISLSSAALVTKGCRFCQSSSCNNGSFLNRVGQTTSESVRLWGWLCRKALGPASVSALIPGLLAVSISSGVSSGSLCVSQNWDVSSQPISWRKLFSFCLFCQFCKSLEERMLFSPIFSRAPLFPLSL